MLCVEPPDPAGETAPADGGDEVSPAVDESGVGTGVVPVEDEGSGAGVVAVGGGVAAAGAGALGAAELCGVTGAGAGVTAGEVGAGSGAAGTVVWGAGAACDVGEGTGAGVAGSLGLDPEAGAAVGAAALAPEVLVAWWVGRTLAAVEEVGAASPAALAWTVPAVPPEVEETACRGVVRVGRAVALPATTRELDPADVAVAVRGGAADDDARRVPFR